MDTNTKLPSPYQQMLDKALPDISALFDSSARKVYKQRDIRKMLAKHSVEWHFYLGIPIRTFTKHLCDQSAMKKVVLVFGKNRSRKETRYIWGNASVYELALSLKNHSYLTHHSAAYLHQLIEIIPDTIYLNSEQSRRTTTSALTQEAIDLAFRNSVRISNNVAQYDNKTICLLNGMYTGQLGVVELIGEEGEELHLTGIERTLIDIAVRPVYSGGVLEVLTIYRNASNKISPKRLIEIYKKMGYVYPYHQVIGFYLDRAGGYDEKDINLFYQIDMPFNFYLTHKMGETSFSDKWKLFYPKELDDVSY